MAGVVGRPHFAILDASGLTRCEPGLQRLGSGGCCRKGAGGSYSLSAVLACWAELASMLSSGIANPGMELAPCMPM